LVWSSAPAVRLAWTTIEAGLPATTVSRLVAGLPAAEVSAALAALILVPLLRRAGTGGRSTTPWMPPTEASPTAEGALVTVLLVALVFRCLARAFRCRRLVAFRCNPVGRLCRLLQPVGRPRPARSTLADRPADTTVSNLI